MIVSSRNGTNLFEKCLLFFLPEVAGYDFFLHEGIDPTPPFKLYEVFFFLLRISFVLIRDVFNWQVAIGACLLLFFLVICTVFYTETSDL